MSEATSWASAGLSAEGSCSGRHCFEHYRGLIIGIGDDGSSPRLRRRSKPIPQVCCLWTVPQALADCLPLPPPERNRCRVASGTHTWLATDLLEDRASDATRLAQC